LVLPGERFFTERKISGGCIVFYDEAENAENMLDLSAWCMVQIMLVRYIEKICLWYVLRIL